MIFMNYKIDMMIIVKFMLLSIEHIHRLHYDFMNYKIVMMIIVI
jgi:hypothetical protein